MTRNFLITIKAYKELFTLYCFDLILFLGIPYALMVSNFCSLLTALALGLSISYFVSYLINYVVVCHTISKPQFNDL